MSETSFYESFYDANGPSALHDLYSFLCKANPSLGSGAASGIPEQDQTTDLLLVEASVHDAPEAVWTKEGFTVMHLAVAWNLPNVSFTLQD